MPTKTESIVGAALTALTNAGINARASTAEAYSFETMPVVVVDVSAESPTGRYGQALGYVYWSLDLSLVIAAESTQPKLAPETTRQAAHAALYADRTLGGNAVDITAGTVTRQIDNENPAAGVTTCVYTIIYRCAETTV